MKFKTIKHYNVYGHAHELTFSCYKNQNFFHDDRVKLFFIEAVNNASEKHNFDVWAYVIMLNHVHLLICPRTDQYSISGILRTIKQSVSRRTKLLYEKEKNHELRNMATGKSDKPFRFWQEGPGFDKNVVVSEAVMNMVTYIHNNPVRKGYVEKPEDWTWSSAKAWKDSENGKIIINLEMFPDY
ncbi:transposase [candidate division KSB1 bacterium]